MKKLIDDFNLEEMYSDFGSISELAAHFGLSYSTMRAHLIKRGVFLNPSSMNVYHELRNTAFTDKHKKVIIASVLGDGTIELPSRAKNPRFELSHCNTQRHYLKWIHNLLKPFSREVKLHNKAHKKKICGNLVNASDFYRFRTVCHPDLRVIYDKYYVDRHKGVHEELLDIFDLFMFSIWFCDDGTVHSRNGSISYLSIATCSFSLTECEFLVNVVKKIFDGNVTVGSRNRLFMYNKDKCLDIIERVKEIVPKSIHYKLGPQRLDVKLPNRDEGTV